MLRIMDGIINVKIKQMVKKTGTASYERRKNDRRKLSSKGFEYITIVGWMCRRERCRRTNDEIDYS
jgi:hypothetical protein